VRLRRTLLSSLTVALAVAIAPTATTPATAAGTPPSGAKAAKVFNESVAPIDQAGTFTPIVGNFGLEGGQDDIVWYAPGSTTDLLWSSRDSGGFFKGALTPQVTGTFAPIVGNFSGDSRDDILWYGPGSRPDMYWKTIGASGQFQQLPFSLDGVFLPLVVHNASHYDQILLWNPRGTTKLETFGGEDQFDSTSRLGPPSGTTPYTGDFDGDGVGDILWYGPGRANAVWYGHELGGFTRVPISVSGRYQPVVHAFTPGQPNRSDILFYDGDGTSLLYQGLTRGKFLVSGHRIPAGVPLAADGRNGLLYVLRRGNQPDWVWALGGTGKPDVNRASGNTKVAADAIALIGRFVGDGDNLFFYRPGPGPEKLLYLNVHRPT